MKQYNMSFNTLQALFVSCEEYSIAGALQLHKVVATEADTSRHFVFLVYIELFNNAGSYISRTCNSTMSLI